jgi:hypothetical protein
MPDRTYTPEEKRECLKQYLLLGTYSAAAEATGVPINTIRSWKHVDREWWDRTQNELITEMEGDYRPGWVRVLGKAIEAIEDRIENGDTVVTKAGLARVPVKGKDLGVLAGIAADKLKQFGVKPAVPDDVAKRRKELQELAKKDQELAQLPVNQPVVQQEAAPN